MAKNYETDSRNAENKKKKINKIFTNIMMGFRDNNQCN